MSLRRKNLLEAFKKSDSAATPAGVPARPEPAAAPQPTLFESAAGVPRAPAGKRPDFVWALVAIGFVAAFVLGFVVGRNTPGEARAEEPLEGAIRPRPASQSRTFQERPPSPAPEARVTPAAGSETAAPSEGRIEDSPLFDAANAWTVIVASYTKANDDLAWATYHHLKDARLPVFPPVASRNLVVVLAGAAPTSAELQKTLTAVQSLARDGQKKDYTDAYCARIDTLIPREKKGTSKP